MLDAWISLSLCIKSCPCQHRPTAETTLGSAMLGPYQTAVNNSLFWKPCQILNCWTQCKRFSLKLLKALHEVLPAYTVSSPVVLKSNVLLQWYSSLLHMHAIVFPKSPTWITIMYSPMKILLITQGLAQIKISFDHISSYPPVSSINSMKMYRYSLILTNILKHKIIDSCWSV